MEPVRKFKIIVNSKECGTCSGPTPSAVAKKVVKKLCGSSSKVVKFSLKECKRGCERVCGPYQGRMEKLDKPYTRDGKKITHRVVCGKVRKMRGGALSERHFIKNDDEGAFKIRRLIGLEPYIFFNPKDGMYQNVIYCDSWFRGKVVILDNKLNQLKTKNRKSFIEFCRILTGLLEYLNLFKNKFRRIKEYLNTIIITNVRRNGNGTDQDYVRLNRNGPDRVIRNGNGRTGSAQGNENEKYLNTILSKYGETETAGPAQRNRTDPVYENEHSNGTETSSAHVIERGNEHGSAHVIERGKEIEKEREKRKKKTKRKKKNLNTELTVDDFSKNGYIGGFEVKEIGDKYYFFIGQRDDTYSLVIISYMENGKEQIQIKMLDEDKIIDVTYKTFSEILHIIYTENDNLDFEKVPDEVFGLTLILKKFYDNMSFHPTKKEEFNNNEININLNNNMNSINDTRPINRKSINPNEGLSIASYFEILIMFGPYNFITKYILNRSDKLLEHHRAVVANKIAKEFVNDNLFKLTRINNSNKKSLIDGFLKGIDIKQNFKLGTEENMLMDETEEKAIEYCKHLVMREISILSNTKSLNQIQKKKRYYFATGRRP